MAKILNKMKQTLWIISELFPPEETSTGYIMGEIAYAMTSKYEVNVISGPGMYDSSKAQMVKNEIEGINKIFRVKGIKENKANKLSRIRKFLLISWRMYRVIIKNVKKDDIVLMVSNPFPLLILVGWLRNRRIFKFNMLVHDVFPESLYTDMYIPSSINKFLSSIFNLSYSKADRIIVLGRDMKEVMQKKIKYINRITIIENWGDTLKIKPRQNNKEFDHRLNIQYAGNIGRAQGISDFLDVLKEADNPNIIMEIWGNGSEIDKVKDKILEYGLDSKVSLKGTYLRSQQNEILASCDIAIVTLVNGMYGLGTPSKSYNILAAGKPILYIGERNTEIWLMVEENDIGFCFEPSDMNGMINLIKTLNKFELKEKGMRARKIVEEKYSKDKILHKFQDIL